MARVKICGIKTPEDFTAAANSKADWVGLVFFPKSPRHLSFDEAMAIRNAADGHRQSTAGLRTPLLTALVVDADDALLDDIFAAAKPDLIQCHGNEPPERIKAIKTRYQCAVMKAIRVKSHESLTEAKAYEGYADIMLFDSAPVDAELPGGTGHAFDWGLMKAYDGTTPWMLAGGLTPHNVAEAIKASGAEAVDVSSGVEDKPGIKNHKFIQDFVTAAL